MKYLKIIVLIGILMNLSLILYAGSVDYLSNQSVQFLRTLSRNAAVDETDAIIYNPAGITKLSSGTYIGFNWQGFTKEYSIKDLETGKKYKTTIPTPFIPSVLYLCKMDKLALFGGFTIPAGGGTLEYKDGLYMIRSLDEGYFKGVSLYYGYTIGFAYQLDDIVSFSMASRYIDAIKEYEGSASHSVLGSVLEIDSKKEASGHGGIFGINLNLYKMNVGIRYETQTTLRFETKTKTLQIHPALAENMAILSDIFENGKKEYRDLPAQLSIGASVEATKDLSINWGYNMYFLEKAAQTNEGYLAYDEGIELQFGAEYKLNKKWLLSAGYNYVIVGGNKDTYSDFEYQLDSHFIGAGFKFTPSHKYHINFAIAKPFYETSKGSRTFEKAEYSKNVNILGIGIEYKI